MDEHERALRKGYMAAFAAYIIWGIVPLYFKLLDVISPFEIVAYRVLSSLAFLALIILIQRQGARFWAALTNRRVVGAMAVSALLIGINWLVYVLAVNNGHILAASLGYFLNPLVSVMLGVIFLQERLRRLQIMAIVLAAGGAINLAFTSLGTLWISASIAVSFALYGLVRMMVKVDALLGLAIETLFLAPLALSYYVTAGFVDRAAAIAPSTWALIVGLGVVTSLPLIMFGYATSRLSLTTMGLLQYFSPSIQFLIGLLAYHEQLDRMRLLSFVVIWSGLAIFTYDGLRTKKVSPAPL